jgi:hypothetical protein
VFPYADDGCMLMIILFLVVACLVYAIGPAVAVFLVANAATIKIILWTIGGIVLIVLGLLALSKLF